MDDRIKKLEGDIEQAEAEITELRRQNDELREQIDRESRVIYAPFVPIDPAQEDSGGGAAA